MGSQKIKSYDVIIAGAGPARIFSAIELLKEWPHIRLLIIDKGSDIDNRICPMKIKEYLDGIWTVNGHSYRNKKTTNTNFALLVSTHFTEPFNEPILYGKYIARLANFLSQGVLVQRLRDLLQGRRSTPERILKGVVQPTLRDAIAGVLSFVIPYRYLSDILEMLEALDRIALGVNSRHILLYGVEVKFYSMHLKLTRGLETEIENLFAIGDGAGVSSGLIHVSVSEMIAVREVIKKRFKG